MVEKENIPSAASAKANKTEERRKQLEDYVRAKREKREAERSVKGQKVPHPKSSTQAPPTGRTQRQSTQPSQILGATATVAIPSKRIHMDCPSQEACGHVTPDASDDCPSQGESQHVTVASKDTEQLGGPEKPSLDSPTIAAAELARVKVNWTAPVYLHHGKCLYRLRRPRISLFRLAQVENAMEGDQTLLASIMLAVLGAEGQCRSRDVRYQVGYWRLRMQLSVPSREQLVQEASRFIPEALLGSLYPVRVHSVPATPCALPAARQQGETPNSPLTPELPPDILLPPAGRTPELDDAETQRMRAEIDDVVRRTPAIQDTPSKGPRAHLLEKALTAIKDTSLFGRNPRHGREDPDRANVEGGSAYLYAMITPSKRLRGLLETDVAVSPVRRSKRLLDRDAAPKRVLYEKIDDIPDMSLVGYVPNSHVDVLMHPRRKLFKADDTSNDAERDDERTCRDQGDSV